ncbi:MAG: hypothetical protein U0168_12680 [Nannocystaceae bacterium]
MRRGISLPSVALLWLLVASSCGHKRISAPYAPGQGPRAQDLLALARPQLDAVAVPDAKVVANRVMRGNLAFLAQAPDRFRGSVQVSGNELVTLAATEVGYALRYKLDAFPAGFYHGPPSSCAIEALLGIAFDLDDLVALVLGGAPLLSEPRETLSQGWDTAGGYEALVVANDRYVESLHFRKQGDGWIYVGGKLWQRKPDGGKGTLLWTLEHEELERHADAVLPARTRIVAPAGKKQNQVVIHYKTRDLQPPFARTQPDDGGDGGGSGGSGPSTTGNDTDGGDEGGDDWGEDDGGWENAEPAATPEPTAAPAPTPPPATATAAPTIPKAFVIDGGGMTDRGDLCR